MDPFENFFFKIGTGDFPVSSFQVVSVLSRPFPRFLLLFFKTLSATRELSCLFKASRLELFIVYSTTRFLKSKEYDFIFPPLCEVSDEAILISRLL